MKAVGFFQSLPLGHPEALMDLELPAPEPLQNDLLVEVRAVSVNPVDCWIRASSRPQTGAPYVLGMDAAGIVHEIGTGVEGFKPGDRVWYSGSFLRQGCSSELSVVDARLAAHMPDRLGFAEAAAIPLTAITAWELLFERLELATKGVAGSAVLLVAGAAGGVGSVLIQLVRALTDLTVIGTASRPDTADWVRRMGAHHVINHRESLLPQLAALGIKEADYVASLSHTDRNLAQLIEVLKPRGHFGLIDASGPMDLRLFMPKNHTVHYQDMGMVTKLGPEAEYNRHQRILKRIAGLFDQNVLQSTLRCHLGTINAKNMLTAHEIIEGGHSYGKVVLEGF
ncbi:zinc-binding alcohol dehydrogenase family protein [Uliginosibacterium gangwonense]|uniref:zinc-binding alcohol dehydrogenase family protein n=1 Tax=Uliginosibacterium gangwonense TaxID=392736 RepID=UPI000382AD2E|nr:zinc-binding alcohol dehydrogenase family protein [Uliginosibacterium gangwonense]